MRFSDHRGIIPSSVIFRDGTLSTTIVRSKTTGADKGVQYRPMVVDAVCFISIANWMSQGWSLLCSLADFQSDYLLPAPSSNFQGCLRRELRYDTAAAIQRRVISSLEISGDKPLCLLAKFWTPHSGRAFMPSATAALGVDKTERDYLGGWSAQGSDRYARVAKRRISNMQKLVVKALQQEGQDKLAEEETIEALEEFMASTGIATDDKVRILGVLSWSPPPAPAAYIKAPEDLEPQSPAGDESPVPSLVSDFQDLDPAKSEKMDKRRKKNLLGLNPRQARESIRAGLAPGFYISVSGKRQIRTLHRLGDCYNFQVSTMRTSFSKVLICR